MTILRDINHATLSVDVTVSERIPLLIVLDYRNSSFSDRGCRKRRLIRVHLGKTPDVRVRRQLIEARLDAVNSVGGAIATIDTTPVPHAGTVQHDNCQATDGATGAITKDVLGVS